MSRISPCDRKLLDRYCRIMSVFLAVASVLLAVFSSLVSEHALIALLLIVLTALVLYTVVYVRACRQRSWSQSISGVEVMICAGDIFEERNDSLSVIAFNEFFDTHVGDGIVSPNTLNGKLLSMMSDSEIALLDNAIASDARLNDAVLNQGIERRHPAGKNRKYKLGTSFRYDRWILTAMTHFDENDNARLTIEDYLSFLMNYWNELSVTCQGDTVRMPLLGSGITRFDGSRPRAEELLNIVLLSLKYCPTAFPSNMKVEILLTDECLKGIDLFHIGDGICN